MIGAFQTKIFERFMSEKQIKDLYDEYIEHRRKLRREKTVTDKDLMILMEYKKGVMVSELARKYGTSLVKINNSLRIAALSKI